MRLSASKIKTWMECPLKAHFTSVLRFDEPDNCKTVFGSCIHEALEIYNTTGDLDRTLDHFDLTWRDTSKLKQPREIEIWYPTSTWPILYEKGIEFLNKFHEESSWESRNIIAAEHEFEVGFGEHSLRGAVDSIELVGAGKKKELRIVDFKTSSSVPTHTELRFDVQFTTYMWASTRPEFWIGIPDGDKLYESLIGAPRRGVWYSIWHNKKIDVGERTELDYMRLARVISEIAHAEEKDVHVPNISGSSCLQCPYTSVCATTIPLQHVLQEERDARKF